MKGRKVDSEPEFLEGPDLKVGTTDPSSYHEVTFSVTLMTFPRYIF